MTRSGNDDGPDTDADGNTEAGSVVRRCLMAMSYGETLRDRVGAKRSRWEW